MSNLLWKSELMNLLSTPTFMEGSHVTRGFDRSDSAAHDRSPETRRNWSSSGVCPMTLIW